MQELTVKGDLLRDVLGFDVLLLVGNEDHAAAIYAPPVLVGPLLGNHSYHTHMQTHIQLRQHNKLHNA